MRSGRLLLCLRRVALGLVVLGALGLASAACSRTEVYKGRIAAIPSEKARDVLRETLWAHGSFFRWADHHNLQCTVTWTEVTPLAETVRAEVWLLDTARGRLRMEAPATKEVVLFDGALWRFFADGKPVPDPVERFRMAGKARVARELAPMPFSLLDPGLDIGYMGVRTGPGEARAWEELLVAYGYLSGREAADRMIVEVRQSPQRVAAVIVQWSELPWAGRRFRVEMDEWQAHEGLLLSHRYRFYWADAKGERSGPLRYEARVTNLALDVPEKMTTFLQP